MALHDSYFQFSCTLPCKRSREQNGAGSYSESLESESLFWVSVCSSAVLRALIQAEPRKMGHIIRYELPKEMLLQCRNRSPDLGNNLYTPAENRSQRVRQIAELWESLGPSLLLTMRIFLGKMLPLELKTPSWHHTRATALTYPTGQPTVTLHIISARTWHRLRWAWAGHWKPPALSPTGPALHPWSLSETSTSAFAATGFGICSQHWLTEQRPHQLPGAWHAHPWAPPALQGRWVIRHKKDLDVFRAWARLCRQGDWAWEREPTRPKPHILSEVKTDPWLNPPLPSPPAPSPKRGMYMVPCAQKASLQALPVHTGSRTLAWISSPDKCNWEGCDT